MRCVVVSWSDGEVVDVCEIVFVFGGGSGGSGGVEVMVGCEEECVEL